MEVLGDMTTKHLSLFLREEELLRSKDGAWSRDTDPANKMLRWDLELLHRI
jgi:hypothetical protein